MAAISSMFKAPKAVPAPVAVAPPKPTPQPVMPAPMDMKFYAVKRSALEDERRRRGRSKTDLTSESEDSVANVNDGSGYDSNWLGE